MRARVREHVVLHRPSHGRVPTVATGTVVSLCSRRAGILTHASVPRVLVWSRHNLQGRAWGCRQGHGHLRSTIHGICRRWRGMLVVGYPIQAQVAWHAGRWHVTAA